MDCCPLDDALLSVIIPAHNEAGVLPLLLEDLLAQEGAVRFEVIVIDAASADATHEGARSFVDRFATRGVRAAVCRSPVRSKAAALDLGDRLRRGGSAAYLDADIRLSSRALASVRQALDSRTGPAVAAPGVRVARPMAPLAARYWRSWGERVAAQNDVIGAGFLAVNSAGRGRWGAFPDLACDDGFVVSRFERSERIVAHDAFFTIYPPATWRDTVLVRARWFRAARGLPRGPRSGLAGRGQRRSLFYGAVTGLAWVVSLIPDRGWYVSQSSRIDRAGRFFDDDAPAAAAPGAAPGGRAHGRQRAV